MAAAEVAALPWLLSVHDILLVVIVGTSLVSMHAPGRGSPRRRPFAAGRRSTSAVPKTDTVRWTDVACRRPRSGGGDLPRRFGAGDRRRLAEGRGHPPREGALHPRFDGDVPPHPPHGGARRRHFSAEVRRRDHTPCTALGRRTGNVRSGSRRPAAVAAVVGVAARVEAVAPVGVAAVVAAVRVEADEQYLFRWE